VGDRSEVFLDLIKGVGWSGRAVPAFPEAGERGGFEVLLLFHVAFGSSAFGLPVFAEGAAGVFEKSRRGGVVTAF